MKDVSPEHLERFKRWYVRPFEWLRHQGGIKHVEPWDGGFISIMIGCSLMERYFRRESNTHEHLSRSRKIRFNQENEIDYDDLFKHHAAAHFKTDTETIKTFYRVFRNGIILFQKRKEWRAFPIEGLHYTSSQRDPAAGINSVTSLRDSTP